MKTEFISPLYDFIFTLIFGDQRHIANTQAFLQTLLDIPEDDYQQLTVVNPGLKRLFRDGKAGIVDVRLTTRSGRVIHIELQVNKTASMRNRVLYYASKLLAEQLKHGDEYEELHQVISIIICDHVLLDDEESYINEYELRNGRNHRFTDLLKVIILELPKVPETEDSPVSPWLRFFKCKKLEECEVLAKKHPEKKEAVLLVKKLSWWEERRMNKEQLSLWAADERIMKKEARAAGLAEGLVEGRAEAHTEIARKMKQAERPAGEITEFTGLSAEEIGKL